MNISKTLENIIFNKLDEVANDDSRYFSQHPDYIKKLMSVVDVDDIEEVESLYQELVFFSQHNEDEITIHYEDGQEVTLDNYVVKQILANRSSEIIDDAGQNIELMHQMLYSLFDDMINIEEE